MKKVLYKQDMSVLEKVVHEGMKLIIWGYRKQYHCLEMFDVAYIVDRNDELCDRKVNGVSIFLPEVLYSEKANNVVIVIATPEKYYHEITSFLNNLSIEKVFYMNVLEKDFLRAISNQLYDSSQKIDEVCSFFEEAYSVKIYKEVINRRICGCETEYGDLKVPDEIQYIFPQALYSKMEGAIIDCGGYIGDSIERFYNKMGVKSIHKIYTFEALPQNLEIIKKLKTSYGEDGNKINIIPAAVSSESGYTTFVETEKKGACHIANKKASDKYTKNEFLFHHNVRCVSIDQTIPKEEVVRYIKMDIEGGEYDALIGAAETIKREKPGLAISIYHSAEDYYRLPLLVKELVPEYKFAVRHHKNKYFDTVLYAWI